ncbi:MAG: dicarboxylate/amino acid:cation symporter [Gammaproteobacteria bacterium]|nr:dicarboxylate/amino acid:cation symporter [Gammaproteobacteria bacterium]|tara:strand:- start:22940 stop:24343 length:1404 start_codon:yes stop_codon:yes gene_type:complete
MLKPLQVLNPRPLRALSSHLNKLVAGRLWLKVLLGMFLGIVVGVLLGPSLSLVNADLASTIGNWLALPGQLFLILVQMIVVPLVFASIIRGLAATDDINQLKKLGLSVVTFFILTTTFAIVLGITLASQIRPGNYIDTAMFSEFVPVEASETPAASTPDLASLPQTLINLFPTNPLNSMVESQMLQVVIFAVIFGFALLMTPAERSRPLFDFLGSLQEVCMTVVRGAMVLAPIAVFGLMAQLVSRIGFEALLGMGVYVLTVLLGLLMMFLVYLLIILVVTRTSPLFFISQVRELLLLAFSTSSSAAVMPLSIKTAEDKLNVRPSIAEFVIPIGATINMNGTALYQGVATIFLAQVYGIDLSLGSLALLVVVAVGASIGSPATPGVGIVILAMVLSTVGIPPSGIALLMGVDRILDMSRTAVNVAGDMVACLVMNKLVGSDNSTEEELQRQESLEAERLTLQEDTLVK